MMNSRPDYPNRRSDFLTQLTPKLFTILRSGYGVAQFRADAVAGLTVAIVALPLSMAIAIASGATPAQGLYTAIIGGFLVSFFGGSRFQIGGPAGAFIVLVASTVAVHGMSGLILATFLSGMMLIVSGYLGLGKLIRFVPFPVTVGFTAGIACIIFASQISDLLGLTLQDEPGELLQKIPALWMARDSLTPAAVGLSAAVIVLILALKHFRPNWPGMLFAVVGTAVVVGLFDLQVATIGTQFGGIPSTLPAPSLPDLSTQKLIAVLPAALSFTLLGAIESLLSAVVADGMSGTRHRSNGELVAQGIANMGTALFGGFCVTGTIARTATNVRAGAHGPVAGMLHAVFLALFMLIAAPLASYIPLAALAGVLAIVAWNMIDRRAISILFRLDKSEVIVFAATLLLTVFRSVTEAIILGVALGGVLFIRRMNMASKVTTPQDCFVDQNSLGEAGSRAVVYSLSGPLFFGSAAKVEAALDGDGAKHGLILDISDVPFLDSSGTDMIARFARKARYRGTDLWIAGANAENLAALEVSGLAAPLVHYAPTVVQALQLLNATR